jgi:hypothetical protein
MSETIRHKYVRDGDEPIGCIATRKEGEGVLGKGKITVAWSACSILDEFRKDVARNIAIGRAEAGHSSATIPPWFITHINEHLARLTGKFGPSSNIHLVGKMPGSRVQERYPDRDSILRREANG